MAVNHLVKVFFVMAFILHTVIREDIAGAEREHVCLLLMGESVQIFFGLWMQ